MCQPLCAYLIARNRFYDFPNGDVVLREQMVIDRAPDGMFVSPSTQYIGTKILPGKTCERIVIGSSTYGFRTSTLHPEIEQTVL